MRLAVIGPTHPFRGGIAHHTTLLVEALRERHDVLFLSFRGQYPRWAFPGRSDRDPSVPLAGTHAEHVLAPMLPLTWWRTARRATAFAPALAVIPWWVPFWAPSIGCLARALRASGCPVLYVCHNVAPHGDRRPFWRALTAFALAPGSAFIVHSEADVAELDALLPAVARQGRPVRRTLLPDFAIAAPIDRAEARRRLGIAPTERVALFFGFVRPYKGLEHLVRALPLALPAVPDLRLLVVGEFWQPVEDYRRLAERLGVAGRVGFVDRYVANEEVAPYFCAADVVVLPYVEATQSAIVTLASRFGLPVIATSVGGLPEAVIDGVTGLIVPPARADALAGALGRILADGELEARLRAGVLAEQHRFGWPAFVDVVEAIAAEVAGPVQLHQGLAAPRPGR